MNMRGIKRRQRTEYQPSVLLCKVGAQTQAQNRTCKEAVNLEFCRVTEYVSSWFCVILIYAFVKVEDMYQRDSETLVRIRNQRYVLSLDVPVVIERHVSIRSFLNYIHSQICQLHSQFYEMCSQFYQLYSQF